MRLATLLAAVALVSECVFALSGSPSPNTPRRPFGPQLKATKETPAALAAFNDFAAPRAFAAKDTDAASSAAALASAFFELQGLTVAVSSVVISEHTGIAHVNLVQTIHGVEVSNCVATANIDTATSRIVSLHSAFTSPSPAPFMLAQQPKQHRAKHTPTDAFLTPLQALDALFADLAIHPASHAGASAHPHPQKTLAKRDQTDTPFQPTMPGQRPHRVAPDFEIILPVVSNSFVRDTRRQEEIAVPATLKYLLTEENEIVPVWDLEVDLGNHYYHAHVDARLDTPSKKTLSLVDWVSENYFDEASEVVYERVVERVLVHGKAVADKVVEGFQRISNKMAQKQKHQGHKTNDKKVAHDKKKQHDVISAAADATGSSSIMGIYNVFPLGTNDPLDGDRQLVKGPLNMMASPNGWHWCSGGKAACSKGNFTDTKGNNVFAQENLDGGYNDWLTKKRPDGTSKLYFDAPADLTLDPETYTDAAVINLFYWNNAIHDLFYVYGFTEAAGNFQDGNLGRGGVGGDAVIANAQDGSGHNNANFATPPDGAHGRMRMYVWDVTDPWRDGDFEGGIIMHEYAHGISTRLTGGPQNSGCLGFGESGGMGEGWGDYFATITRMTPTTTREFEVGMGEYANGGSGIRKFKYSTNNETNPSTYSYVSKPGYWGVHAKGEVWAEILYEVYWNLVDAHGFNADWFDTPMTRASAEEFMSSTTYTEFRTGRTRTRTSSTITFPSPSTRVLNPYPMGGNVLAMQLVVDGLKLQPCNPSFVDARDAILEADEILTGGKNKCLLWTGFAKRGLGVGAKDGGVEGWRVPKGCK
ncbi:Fungalysin/Thermolysin Extracellular metalloproteinase 5 [Podochytrium sp. JEL0797]|nr:Fungalysin/Thermolysin Extracellular metalloproteinase 5 [Podochytrium sp. JEL0797]